jgi:hypothetical protein
VAVLHIGRVAGVIFGDRMDGDWDPWSPRRLGYFLGDIPVIPHSHLYI